MISPAKLLLRLRVLTVAANVAVDILLLSKIMKGVLEHPAHRRAPGFIVPHKPAINVL